MKYLPSLLLLCVVFCVGCANHYRHVRIVDSTTNQTYYAKYATQSRLGLNFRDARTGALVELENAEIFPMTPEKFEEAVEK